MPAPGHAHGETPPLSRIIYCSVMDFDRDDLPFTKEIQAILDWSRTYNPTVGITGALMVGEARFAQVLEGPLPALKALFANIAMDPRHRRVLLLHSGPIEERDFGDWSMAFVSRDQAAAIPLSSRPRGSNLHDASLSAGGVLSMLRHIVRENAAAAEHPGED